MKVIMKILNVSQGYIAIEDNKPDAIKTTNAVKDKRYPGIKPSNQVSTGVAEKQLIYTVTGRQSSSGGLPLISVLR